MTPKEKAKELFDKYANEFDFDSTYRGYKEQSKKCALICVEIEYNSLREQLFNLRSCRVIENKDVYLKRLEKLIDEELEVKTEIENL